MTKKDPPPAWLKDAPRSLDPTDWLMYSDILTDGGSSEEDVAATRQVADSLRAEPRMYLGIVGGIGTGDRCRWFITTPTLINGTFWLPGGWSSFRWFKPAWVAQPVEGYHFGTPFDQMNGGAAPPQAADDMGFFLREWGAYHRRLGWDALKHDDYDQLVSRFWEAHASAGVPEWYEDGDLLGRPSHKVENNRGR